eukprot:m.44601 g.44601  ORF g.44601 m.44601 type:complete len:315 (+) comp10125_c0_seq1:246-1190(+)
MNAAAHAGVLVSRYSQARSVCRALATACIAGNADHRFNTAIVRLPTESITEGLTTSSHLGHVNFSNALQQHRDYTAALSNAGVENVVYIPELPSAPDACFVEDTAFVTEFGALVTFPGACTRIQETSTMYTGLSDVLNSSRPIVSMKQDTSLGTLDGGDVMRIKRHVFIGLSSRTDILGATNLQQWVQKTSGGKLDAVIVDLNNENSSISTLHLKTVASYIGNDTLLVTKEASDAIYPYVRQAGYEEIQTLCMADGEEFGANALRVNDHVLLSAGCEKTKVELYNAGFKVLEVDTSEYRKIDGGLSCLSVRFWK